MFTKNIFKDKDTVADLVGNILEADYKVKKEELKGNQHKIDMNKNNKIDAHDFKLLRSKGTQKEEVDQIDELSSGTIDRYRKKLGTTLDTKPAYTTAAVAAQKEKNAPIRAKIHNALMKQHQAIRRERGMSEPAKKLPEEVEQVDERTLTPSETSEKERIVKGMKKSLAGFKQRYGDRAKSVMYATATKAAKED